MNVIGSHVSRQKSPAAMQTNLPQGTQDRRPAALIQVIGPLIHLFAFHGATLRADLRERTAKHIVMLVHNIGIVTVQVRPVARESDEVPHSGAPLPLLYSRGSETQHPEPNTRERYAREAKARYLISPPYVLRLCCFRYTRTRRYHHWDRDRKLSS